MGWEMGRMYESCVDLHLQPTMDDSHHQSANIFW